MPDQTVVGGKASSCAKSQCGGSGCQAFHLTEENVRFVLLALLLYIYLCLGAFIFQAVEEKAEAEMRESFHSIYTEFKKNLTLLNAEAQVIADTYEDSHDFDEAENGVTVSVTEEDLLRLLYAYGNATKAGVFLRQRWDWIGSFHFAWTVVSTIGYGATTPTTVPGQLLIIPYGFFGCAGGLLFFNLFLERIITFLTTCMRCYRAFRRNRNPDTLQPIQDFSQLPGTGEGSNGNRPTDGPNNSQSIASPSSVSEEKPSVTWVMLSLFLMSTLIIAVSAGLYHSVEGWTYVESLYFAFVSYATIGFGDFVTCQQISYGSLEILYRIAAFAVMVIGCCCIYSLLNVTSIVIKRFLNWIINRLECPCCFCCACLNTHMRRSLSTRRRLARIHKQQYANSSGRSPRQGALGDFKIGNESHPHHSSIDMEDNERRCSGENLVVLRRELSNKVTMAVMQKRLFETSRHNRTHTLDSENEFSVRNVGPLAIVSEKFGDNAM